MCVQWKLNQSQIRDSKLRKQDPLLSRQKKKNFANSCFSLWCSLFFSARACYLSRDLNSSFVAAATTLHALPSFPRRRRKNLHQSGKRFSHLKFDRTALMIERCEWVTGLTQNRGKYFMRLVRLSIIEVLVAGTKRYSYRGYESWVQPPHQFWHLVI